MQRERSSGSAGAPSASHANATADTARCVRTAAKLPQRLHSTTDHIDSATQQRPCRGTQTNAVLHSCQKITCAPESSDAVVCDSACDAVSESSRFISRVRSLMYSLVRE